MGLGANNLYSVFEFDAMWNYETVVGAGAPLSCILTISYIVRFMLAADNN
jgi:hypothetical protein